jgi:AGZA family xanthine/uracil permease-like MFS transporter
MMAGEERPGRRPWREQATRMALFFDLENNGTDFRTEILAGLTTFLATMYIIVVNPAIVAAADMPFPGVLTATVLVSALASIGMGLWARNPIVVAPGMSLNTLFAVSVVKTGGVPWETALGCVFWSGAIFLALASCDRNKRLVHSIPRELRFGIAGGIGLFIALLGLETGGIASGAASASRLGLAVFLAGLVITAILMARQVRGSFILGIGATTLIAWAAGLALEGGPCPAGQAAPLAAWTGWWAPPDFSLFARVDLLGALKVAHWPVILVFFFSCFFDSLGTCVGVCEAGNLVDEEGVPRRLGRSLQANAIWAALSPILGATPATAYIESATGVKEGGRTGLTAVVAGLLFLPFLFLSPLLSLIPAVATAPVLVLVGVFMMKPLIYLRWERFDETVPFFLALILMPLAHSISVGIIWGCLSWTAIKVGCGRWRQVPPFLWAMDGVMILVLATSGRFFH